MSQVSDYDRAVAARLADDPALAVSLLEPWLAERPDDADARLQYGYALLALGRFDEAEAAFQAVLAIAPDYADAQTGLTLVRQRRASPKETRQPYVIADGSLSDLEGGQSDWHEGGITLALPVGSSDTMELRGNWFERFDLKDTELSVSYTHRATDDLWLRLAGSATPDADFRPEVGIIAGFDYRLGRNAVATLDAGWQRFPLQEVLSLRGGLTRYFGGGRFALSAFARAVLADGGDPLLGGSLRADYLPRERARLFVGVASGPETDLGEVRDTTSLFGGGEIPLTDDISLLGSLAREWRETGADRTEGRLGVKLVL